MRSQITSRLLLLVLLLLTLLLTLLLSLLLLSFFIPSLRLYAPQTTRQFATSYMYSNQINIYPPSFSGLFPVVCVHLGVYVQSFLFISFPKSHFQVVSVTHGFHTWIKIKRMYCFYSYFQPSQFSRTINVRKNLICGV